jgi:predicted phosphate transport protein (TIGR00153 family)
MVGWFKKIIFGGEKEEEVIEMFKEYLKTVRMACEIFKIAIETDDKSLLAEVCELEKVGDTIRRDIALKLYEGAFLPIVRGNLYKLAETIDEILDMLEDISIEYSHLISELDPEIRELCVRVAGINLKMSEYLSSAFEALGEEEDLKDKTIKIRVREREVDTLKHELHKKLVKKEIKNYWEGKVLSDFIEDLVKISDIIEDAGDIIQILNVSLR